MKSLGLEKFERFLLGSTYLLLLLQSQEVYIAITKDVLFVLIKNNYFITLSTFVHL